MPPVAEMESGMSTEFEAEIRQDMKDLADRMDRFRTTIWTGAVTILLGTIVQSSVVTWKAASVDTTVRHNIEDVAELKTDMRDTRETMRQVRDQVMELKFERNGAP